MLENSPYPLLSLKIIGTICPCLEKEDDGPARRAAWALSSIPIRWHRRLRGSSSSADGGAASAVGGFLSGMFGGSSSSGGGALGGGDTYDPVEGAMLSVVDAGSGPQLVASPPVMSGIRKKCIPLKLIKTVQARKGGIINLGSRSGIEILDQTGREILRFDVLKSMASSPPTAAGDTTEEEDWENAESVEVEDAEETTCDSIIEQLETLIEWERRRQAYIVTLGEDETENAEEEYVDEYDDDDGTTPASSRSGKKKGVIAEKAQKMKHFAEREIEMKRVKKERENRKAKYVKEAGGLKYTAIAMANRS
mmetsp:Transcript_3964/g.8744  ORF Transcript_3964/g.8744 Transcript_3964/m.8744 type:complete len:308 (-) Transcript_3964:22-945(-)